MKSKHNVAVHWFRKGLRLHDNPALLYASENGAHVIPVFCLDTEFVVGEADRIGPNRWRFLFDSLADLQKSLKERHRSRLVVLRRTAQDESVAAVLIQAMKRWGATLLTFEIDTEPYARLRDKQVEEMAESEGITVHCVSSHTLFDLKFLYTANGHKPCSTFGAFLKLISSIGIEKIKPAADIKSGMIPFPPTSEIQPTALPTLKELGLTASKESADVFPAGETEALAQLARCLARPDWIRTFAKPQTSPMAPEMDSTTQLSAHLKFGTLSARHFWCKLAGISLRAIDALSRKASTPTAMTRDVAESLHGQLCWREFYYLAGFAAGSAYAVSTAENPFIAVDIPWSWKDEALDAWARGQTGFPVIDSLMRQLGTLGWMHHLGRQIVSCFLTRGHLFESWERGVAHFERLLIDADWSLNTGNWLWMSGASVFFRRYWHVYSPIRTPYAVKSREECWTFIRRWCPELANLPEKYLLEPWTAPQAVQEAAGCVIGRDYPERIIRDPAATSRANIARFKKSVCNNL